MVWSQYNFTFDFEGKYFLYNSLSNSFAELDKETYDTIAQKDKLDIALLDENLYKQFLQMKVFVEDQQFEISKIRYLSTAENYKTNRLMLTINPTLDCNFACPYCFEGNHTHRYMTDEVEDAIVAYVSRHHHADSINVTWFGGEPLLAFRRIESLTQKLLQTGKNYSAGIITNGYLLSERIVSKFSYLQIRSIQLTLDGLAETHDKRRCLRNGGATFNKIVQNAKMLHRLCPNVNVAIRVNIDKNNEDDFINIYKQFQSDVDCRGIKVYPAFVEDFEKENANDCICNSMEQNRFLMELYQKYGLEFIQFYPKSGRQGCAIRNPYSIVVGPQGELYKCWNDVGDASKIYGYIDGRITNERLLLRYLTASDPFEDAECKKCLLLPLCNGGCPYLRLKKKDGDKSVNTCLLMKYHLREYLVCHYLKKKK